MVAFAGLHPARGTDHLDWALASMRDQTGVAFRVPAGFDRYVRILHDLDDAEWDDVGPEWTRPAGGPPPPYPFHDRVAVVDGCLSDRLVDLLAPVLAGATATPELGHYGLWNGWGWFTTSSVGLIRGRWKQLPTHHDEIAKAFLAACPIRSWWGGRDMWLFDGPIEAAAAIGRSVPGWRRHPDAFSRQSPQWWFPADRAWFVGTEIDDPCTYLAGSDALVTAILGRADIRTVEVDRADRW